MALYLTVVVASNTPCRYIYVRYDVKPLVQAPGAAETVETGSSSSAISGCSTVEDRYEAVKVYIVQEYCNGGKLRDALGECGNTERRNE
jgi:hypothetical protein